MKDKTTECADCKGTDYNIEDLGNEYIWICRYCGFVYSAKGYTVIDPSGKKFSKYETYYFAKEYFITRKIL